MNKVIFIVLVLIAFGCDKEPCLDVPELDRLSAEAKEWFVNDSIDYQILSDENGISQTLEVTDTYTGGNDDSVEDDCGNTYGSFYNSTQYRTSVSPLHIDVDIHGGALPENGFYLKLSVATTDPYKQKSTTYDFVTKSTRENNASVEFFEQVEISNKEYIGVMKITFNYTTSVNDIKTLFFAKGYGVVKFIEGNGISFVIN